MRAPPALLLLSLLTPAGLSPLSAHGAAPVPSESAEPEEEVALPEASASDGLVREDPCEAYYLAGASWLDWLHRTVQQTVCETAFWLDRQLGGDDVFAERDQTGGRIRAGLLWDEREGYEPVGRFRAKVSFPRLERRLNAIVGRGDGEEFVRDRRPDQQRVPAFFGDPDEDEWLVGLGYSPLRSSRNRFDLGGGMRIATPVEPYLKARYRHHEFFSERALGRFRQTLFWESEDGLGTTSRIDLERVLGARSLMRWRTLATLSESSLGVDWRTNLSLFQSLGGSRAIAYQAEIDGETDAPVPTRAYTARLIYRQNVFRDWFYLDVRPVLSYRRDEPGGKREWVPGVGVAFELVFGNL